MQPLDLHAHLDAQLGVQVGQRLVEQEQQRIAHQRASHRHALALPAGELRRLAVQQCLDLQQLRHTRSTASICWRFGTRRHSPCRRSCSAAPSSTGRARRTGTPSRCCGPSRATAVPSAARRSRSCPAGGVQPGDDVEQRRFAAAGRADQDGELAAVDARDRCPSAPAAGRSASRHRGCASAPSFHRAGGQAAQEIAAAEQVDQQRRRGGQQHRRALLAVMRRLADDALTARSAPR